MSKAIGVVATSIEPDEIIFSPVSITVEFKEGLTQAQAEASVKIRGTRGSHRLSHGSRRVTWSPEGQVLPGFYTLTVLTPPAKNGKVQRLEIPFRVVRSKAKPASHLVVESFQRLSVDNGSVRSLDTSDLPRGKYFEVMKARDRKTGRCSELAFDERGRKADPIKVLKRSMECGNQPGKVHSQLRAAIAKLPEPKRVPVALWLEFTEALTDRQHLALRNRSSAKMPREVLRDCERMMRGSRTLASEMESRGVSNVRIDTLAPVVYADLNAREIQTWARKDSVRGLFLVRTEGIDDLKSSISIHDTDDVHALGRKGRGVRVAVWEQGPDVTTNLSIQAEFDTSAGASTSSHARLTHAIIKNSEPKKPHGHAPDCTLYSANSYDLDALRWAVRDRNCTVISQSFHRDEEQTDSALSFDDIYKDWLALRWPYPTIVQASGNDPSPDVEYVNHKGYNSLAVGSHNDDATAMAATSVYRNPGTPHGDRELPEICANGADVSAVGVTNSGTSFAAPAVAGIAAVLQSTDGTLKHWPEGCRALLLAGARRNVKDGSWWKDVRGSVDAADGAGSVNAKESHRIAKSRRFRNASPTARGWDVGLLRSRDFDRMGLSTFAYRVTVPSTGLSNVFGPRDVRVALAWSSRIVTWGDIFPFFPFDYPITSTLAVDLDLKVYDSAGNQVGYSGSWDNSYEIAQFRGTPGETYTIRIRRWSGTDNTWFGIAWTVTGGLLIFDALRERDLTAIARRLEW